MGNCTCLSQQPESNIETETFIKQNKSGSRKSTDTFQSNHLHTDQDYNNTINTNNSNFNSNHTNKKRKVNPPPKKNFQNKKHLNPPPSSHQTQRPRVRSTKDFDRNDTSDISGLSNLSREYIIDQRPSEVLDGTLLTGVTIYDSLSKDKKQEKIKNDINSSTVAISPDSSHQHNHLKSNSIGNYDILNEDHLRNPSIITENGFLNTRNGGLPRLSSSTQVNTSNDNENEYVPVDIHERNDIDRNRGVSRSEPYSEYMEPSEQENGRKSIFSEKRKNSDVFNLERVSSPTPEPDLLDNKFFYRKTPITIKKKAPRLNPLEPIKSVDVSLTPSHIKNHTAPYFHRSQVSVSYNMSLVNTPKPKFDDSPKREHELSKTISVTAQSSQKL